MALPGDKTIVHHGTEKGNRQNAENRRRLEKQQKGNAMKIERDELIEMILNELHGMDVKSLKLVAAFIRGLKKRSRRIEE